jgi:PleD family two-component response regulator
MQLTLPDDRTERSPKGSKILLEVAPRGAAHRKIKEISEEDSLKDKVVLVVDDDPDALDAIADILHTCLAHKVGRCFFLTQGEDV